MTNKTKNQKISVNSSPSEGAAAGQQTKAEQRTELASQQAARGAVDFDAVQGMTEQRTELGSSPSEGAVTGHNDAMRKINKPQVVFFGNGPLSDATLTVLQDHCDILFHARSKSDLADASRIKQENPKAFGILASFGVMIRSDLLDLFEPEGILNLHPSLLPKYRGASPIESAILAGDSDFSYSIMKLVKAMDAGPIYHQETLKKLPLNKLEIYHHLATAGANWLVNNLHHIRQLNPVPQNEADATFTEKFDKSLSSLHPEQYTASEVFRQIIAYQDFPKPKYTFFGKTCIILEAHVLRVTDILCEAAGLNGTKSSPLMIKCADRNFVVIDRLQPEGKKPIDAISFVNGYGKPNKN